MATARRFPQDVDRHFLALRQSVAALRRHTGLSSTRLLLDGGRRRSIERGLQLYARSVLELTRRIGPANQRNPAAYPSSIACLVASRVLPPELGEQLEAFGAEGDALGQGRSRLSRARMSRILADHLDDFNALADHIERWLDQRRSQ
jgi:uncharacterized protein YutE (UPF0331/DUF86 family)